MAFLVAIVVPVLKWILAGLGGYLLHAFQTAWKDHQEKKTDESATQKAIDDLKNAKTPGDIDNAAKGVSDNV